MRTRTWVTIGLALAMGGPASAGPVEDAQALQKQGKKSDAATLLEKAAEANPSDCSLKRAAGDAWFDAGDADLGAILLEQYVRECAKDPGAAEVKQRLIRHYDGRAAANAPPEGAGSNGVYLVPLPPRTLVGGRTEEDAWAIEKDSRIERLGPVDESIELMRVGEHKKAVAVLETYLKKRPGDGQAWRFLGTARGQAGDALGAVSAYEKYLAIVPNAPDAEPIRRSIAFVRKK